MTPLCVAVDYCDELFLEHLRRRGLNRLYRSSARGKMLDWRICHPPTHPLQLRALRVGTDGLRA
jgi:hypothetical protein